MHEKRVRWCMMLIALLFISPSLVQPVNARYLLDNLS